MNATYISVMRKKKKKRRQRFSNAAQVSIVLPVLYPGYLGP